MYTNSLCKINPRNPGCGGGSGKKGQNGNKNGQNAGQSAERGNRGSGDFKAQIAAGKIPGEPGKDYPVNSLAAFRKRPGFENIELAPDHLITPDYPGLGQGGNKSKKPAAPRGNNRPATPRRNGQNGGRKNKPATNSGSSNYCPGSSLEDCIKFCPSDESGSEFAQCVTECGNSCSK